MPSLARPVRGFLVVATALSTSIGLAPEALAQGDGAYQTAAFMFDQTEPASPSGTMLDVDYFHPSDPTAKPVAVTRAVIEAAPGSHWDTSVPARCTASDAQLMSLGEAACPARSKVGEGQVVVDSGFPGPARYAHAHITFFNNTDELIYLNTVATIGLRTVVRAEIKGNRITTDAGALPGTPPDGGAIDEVHTVDPAVVVEEAGAVRSYFTTPSECPDSGQWINTQTFTYSDGTTQTTTNPTPCDPSSSGAPDTRIKKKRLKRSERKLRVSFEATGAPASGFECRLRGPKPGGPGRRTKRFKDCFPPKSYRHLEPGRYRFSVRALGPGGPDATPAKARFRI